MQAFAARLHGRDVGPTVFPFARRRGCRTIWLRMALIEAAFSAARTNDTYLAAQYRRLKARRGPSRAAIAVCHSILAGQLAHAPNR